MASQMRVVRVGGGLGVPPVMAVMPGVPGDIAGSIAVTDPGRPAGKVRIATDRQGPRLETLR